jgi:uncharacterized cupredoxin-like copper-binding protein
VSSPPGVPNVNRKDVMRKYVIASLLSLALVAAAVVPLAASAAGTHRVTIRESEFKLTPKRVHVAAGRVTFVLRNVGRFPHALTVEHGGRGGHDVSSKTIRPGQSTSFTVRLKRGRYEIYCPVDGHKGMGMVGSLTVG